MVWERSCSMQSAVTVSVMPCVAGIHVWLQRLIACRDARHSLSFMLCCLYRMVAFWHQQGLPAGVDVTFSLHPWCVWGCVCVCWFCVWCVYEIEKKIQESVCVHVCAHVFVCTCVYMCVCHLQVVYDRDWTGRCQQKRKLQLHSSWHYTCIWCIFSGWQFAKFTGHYFAVKLHRLINPLGQCVCMWACVCVLQVPSQKVVVQLLQYFKHCSQGYKILI